METSNKHIIEAICIALAICFSALMATNASADEGVEAQGHSFSVEKSAIITDHDNSVMQDPATGPHRDDPGDILAEYEVPYPSTLGMAWDPDNGWMWGINHYRQPRLYAINPEDGEVVADFQLERSNVIGLFYLDGVLYIGGGDGTPGTIFRYDTDGNALENWESPINLRDVCITSDGEFLFTCGFGGGVIHVFSMDDLEEVDVIDYNEAVGGAGIFSVEWVNAHPRGQLWLSAHDRLYECFVDGDWNCELVQDFETVAGDLSGIAHDGENLWRGIFDNQTWYVIDDGVEEVQWLSYEPSEFEVEAEEQEEVIVTINCEGLVQGLYEADMTFTSNDPDDDGVVVSIGIDVVGAPNIEVTWLEEYGYPDVVDWNAAYDEVFTGAPYEITVEVTNNGTADLEVDEIFCENEYFTADPVDMILEHDQSAEVTLFFETPEGEAGNFDAVMVFASNDPDNREFEIALHAEALLPPEIRVEPNAIEDELFTGAVEDYIITVFNDGEAPLRVTVTHEILDEPERDEVNRYRGSRVGRSVRRTTGGDAHSTGSASLFR